MGEAKQKSSVEALRLEIAALRQANDGLRQRVRELEARTLRQQAQAQEALARSQATEVELRIALSRYVKGEADAADLEVAKHRPAGQVGGAPKQG